MSNQIINFQYPIYFGTTEEEFSRSRKRGKQIRLNLRRDLSDDSLVTAQQTPEPQLSGASQLPEPQPKAPVGISWSSIAQKSLSSAQEVQAVPEISQVIRPTVPVANGNGIESLAMVLIRVMYQGGYVPKTVPHIRPRGLVNTGNICFMSSILQVLLYSAPFYNMIRVIEKRAPSTSLGSDGATPLLDALIDFFGLFSPVGSNLSEFGAPLNPQKFYQSISKHLRFLHLKWGQQEDAEEFLGYYLDGLHEELSAVLKDISKTDRERLLLDISVDSIRALVANTLDSFSHDTINGTVTTTESDQTVASSEEWQEVGVKKNKGISKRVVEVRATPITQLFGGQFRSELEVLKLKDPRSVTLDPFQHVQLDISSADSLEAAFKLLSEPEQILYKSSQDKEIFAKKQTFIDKLPRVLVIHLKRFLYSSDSSRVEKIKKKINYGHVLEIPNECLSKNLTMNNAVSKKYKLTGVVYHHGSSPDIGHYTVDVLRQDKGTWIRIDDTKVESISLEDAINDDSQETKSAYILIYEKVALS